MMKVGLAVTMSCLAAVFLASNPALSAPRYYGHPVMGVDAEFDTQYFGHRNVGVFGSVAFGRRSPRAMRGLGGAGVGNLQSSGFSPSRLTGGISYGRRNLSSRGTGMLATTPHLGQHRGLGYLRPGQARASALYFGARQYGGTLTVPQLTLRDVESMVAQ